MENINFLGKAITVTSENGAATTTIDGGQNGSVATFLNGETSASVLDGFTITRGSQSYGGGVRCGNGSSPTIKNCIIIGNSATTYVGGYGGGIYCDSLSSPTITDCTITNNQAARGGGGIHAQNAGSLEISNSIISNNTAATGTGGRGGGIWYLHGSIINLTNCIISGNTTNGQRGFSYGAGVLCEDGTMTLTNCAITGNTASNDLGGGVTGGTYGTVILTNCTVTGNTVATTGAGVFGITDGTVTLTNCTVTGNVAGTGGGAVYVAGTPLITITNSILYSNMPDEILGNATVTYSDVQGGYAGIGNIDANPLFVADNCGKSNFALDPYSPCIDAGTSLGAPTNDLCGALRDSTPDMGAYEYVVVTCAIQITKAAYDYVSDSLAVEATSPYGQDALLELVGYAPPEMTWDRRNLVWTKTVTGVVAPPVNVTIYGPIDNCEATVD